MNQCLEDEIMQSGDEQAAQTYRGYSYSLDQVNYCIEMCEDTFKVEC